MTEQNDRFDWESDEHLAAAANLPVLDIVLRRDLLAATTRVIRVRKFQRIGLQAAAVVLVFVSGMLTMAQFRESTALPAQQNPVANANVSSIEPLPPSPPIYADPEALARAYDAASHEERLRLLKGAGDYELNTRSDVRSALTFYEQWVHLADEPTRTKFDDSDTWLLASLKHE